MGISLSCPAQAFLSGRRTAYPAAGGGDTYCGGGARAPTRDDLLVLARHAKAGSLVLGPLERHGELMVVVAAAMGWDPRGFASAGAPRARIAGAAAGDGNTAAVRVGDLDGAAARRLRALHPLDGELLALAHATLDAAEVARTG